mmetsp:Transcript_39921/g.97865  ORF Transcript_39921/g.97865 Transcript_39921/m.97865 type:complete len:263 (+) Transcript_39921:181-969(+)
MKSIISLFMVLAIMQLSFGNEEWSYESETGPGHWADLGFDQCGGSNRFQAPIDLVTSRAVRDDSRQLSFSHNRSAFTVSQAHGAPVFTCKVPGGCGGVSFGDDEYDLVQFHFHSLSENAINGAYGALEVHFVHARILENEEVKYLVMSRIYGTSQYDNDAFSSFFNAGSIAADGNAAEFYIDPDSDMYGDAMEAENKIYFFQGSFTTPPCTAEVQWLVFEKFGTIGENQMPHYVKHVEKTAQKGNNRPVQPLNGRPIAYTAF